MPYLSPEKRARICALLDMGFSTRSIATRERVSNVTVWKTGKRRHEGHDYKDSPYSGRPRLFTERAEWRTLQLLNSGKLETAVDIQKHFRTEENLDISANTIRQIFQRNGLVARIKKKASPYEMTPPESSCIC